MSIKPTKIEQEIKRVRALIKEGKKPSEIRTEHPELVMALDEVIDAKMTTGSGPIAPRQKTTPVSF
jgi:hypothetical protein